MINLKKLRANINEGVLTAPHEIIVLCDVLDKTIKALNYIDSIEYRKDGETEFSRASRYHDALCAAHKTLKELRDVIE